MSTANGLDLARLAIIFDTTTAPVAISAMQQVVAQSRNVGQAIDQNTIKQRESAKASKEAVAALTQLNQAHAAAASGYKRGTTDGQSYARTVMDIKAALDAEARSAVMVANGHQQRAAAISRLMTQARTDYQAGATSARTYADNLARLQVEMNKIVGAQNTMATSGRDATRQMAMLSGAVGGFVGVLGFQAMSGLTQFATFIAGLPGDLAHAGDQLERLTARLTFAYRGSAEAARQARQDIIQIARDTAMPYSMVAQGYGDLAIAGRGPGLSRQQIGGLAGAFPMLAQMTGSDTASTGRAMWQFQQALALGRLTSQDYRFMATNMPAIDDALAAGMGVDVNTIPMRISRGEISAEKMVDALIRGVETLRESAGGLPETMERARGRIQTEWELLLTNIEERVKSSEFYQGVMNWYGAGLRNSGDLLSNDPQTQLDANRRLLAEEWFGPNRWWYEREIARLEPLAEAAANDPSRRIAGMTDAARTRAIDRRGLIGRANQAADSIFTLDLARADMAQTIQQLRDGLTAAQAPMTAADLSVLRLENRRMQERQEQLAAQGMGDSPEYRRLTTSRMANNSAISSGMALPPDEMRRLEMALAGATAQLARMVSVVERRRMDADDAESDLQRYGGGAGFDIAQATRAFMAQAAGQGIYVDDVAARNMILRERRLGAEREVAQMAAANTGRQGVVDAASGDAGVRRRAALDADVARWTDEQFGNRADLSPAQQADADAQASAYRRERAREIAQGDVQALRERERADRERLESLRQQLALGIQLGQQGRIAAAQAQREMELRREFPEITTELVALERARVAELVKASEELALQQRQMGLLADAAQIAGHTFSEALREGIGRGARDGVLKASYFLDVLEDRALRIMDRLLEAALAPLDRAATNFFDQLLGNILPSVFGGGGGGGGELAFVPGFASGVKNYSGGWALVGEEGPELVNLPRGANVYSHAESMAMTRGGGGANVEVNIINQSGGEVEQTERQGPNGEQIIDVIVRDKMRANVMSGKLDSQMNATYGARRAIKTA